MDDRLSSQVLGWFAALFALGCCVVPERAASQPLRAAAGAYELEVLVQGAPAPRFEHAGESYVLGRRGSRYVLRIHNRASRRIEAVVSVDGLDVIDGKPGDFIDKRGYLVPAHGFVDIEGWRLSEHEAAAFRFAPIGQSYAAKSGRARNVGVIGVAVFPERERPALPRYYAPRAEDRANLQSADAADARRAEAAPAPPSAAGAAQASRAAPARERRGLGTEFGEAVDSQIHETSFTREDATHPAALLGVRYDDRAGLRALGIALDDEDERDLALRRSADPFPQTRRFARPPADWRRDCAP